MKPVIGWYIKQRVILYRGFGDQTLEDIQNSSDKVLTMLEKGKAPVHIIIDGRYLGAVPTNLSDMSKATAFLNHISVGWVITVATSPVINFLGGILPEMSTAQHYRVLTDLNAAIAFLKEQEPNLNWSAINTKLLDK